MMKSYIFTILCLLFFNSFTSGQKSDKLLRYKEHIKKLKSLEVDTLPTIDSSQNYKVLFLLKEDVMCDMLNFPNSYSKKIILKDDINSSLLQDTITVKDISPFLFHEHKIDTITVKEIMMPPLRRVVWINTFDNRYTVIQYFFYWGEIRIKSSLDIIHTTTYFLEKL